MLLLVLALASCDLSQSDAPDCSGAVGLRQEHADLLACAGWLEYVEERVCTVDYVDIIPTEQPNTRIFGQAFCDEGRIEVALMENVLKAIDPAEVAVTIVHEAAHQEDRCRDREGPAVQAEIAFKRALCEGVRLNRQGCRAAVTYCAL